MSRRTGSRPHASDAIRDFGCPQVHALRSGHSTQGSSVVSPARNFRVNGQALFELEGGGNMRVASGSRV